MELKFQDFAVKSGKFLALGLYPPNAPGGPLDVADEMMI
jgi:hypothetical protein